MKRGSDGCIALAYLSELQFSILSILSIDWSFRYFRSWGFRLAFLELLLYWLIFFPNRCIKLLNFEIMLSGSLLKSLWYPIPFLLYLIQGLFVIMLFR